jgi:hypothetical protein
MTELTIDVDDWAGKLGLAARVLAYYDLENAKRMDEWKTLLAPGATYTTPFDGKMPETVLLVDRIESTLRGTDNTLDSTVVWACEVAHNTVATQIEVRGTFAGGEDFFCLVIATYEFNDDGLVERVTVFQLHPEVVANIIASTDEVARVPRQLGR